MLGWSDIHVGYTVYSLLITIPYNAHSVTPISSRYLTESGGYLSWPCDRLLSRTHWAQERGETARSRKLYFYEYFSLVYTTTRLSTRVTTGILEMSLRNW